jgi:PAS domain-containing protein
MERSASQRPIELILARNLLSSLSTPAFLANAPGDIIFYNDAAGAILGQRFEETGKMSSEDWTGKFGPFAEDGRPIPLERQPLTIALRANRPGHAVYRIRSRGGAERKIEASGLPIVGIDGFQGAMVFFWPAEEDMR